MVGTRCPTPPASGMGRSTYWAWSPHLGTPARELLDRAPVGDDVPGEALAKSDLGTSAMQGRAAFAG